MSTNKKNLILNLALKQFNEKGYVGTSINDIAKESNISKSTMFHYFKNKEDLFNQVFLKSKNIFIKNNFTSILDISTDDFIEALEFQYNHQEEMKFFNQFEYSPYISEESRNIVKEIYKPVINSIIKQQHDHQMIDLDPIFICMFITNTLVTNYNKLFINNQVDREYAIKIHNFIKKALTY